MGVWICLVEKKAVVVVATIKFIDSNKNVILKHHYMHPVLETANLKFLSLYSTVFDSISYHI